MFYEPIGVSEAEALALEISRASATQRVELQPAFSRILADMRRSGTRIPTRLANLHDQLLEEAMEARFDNLPI